MGVGTFWMLRVIWPPGRPPELPVLLYPEFSCGRQTHQTPTQRGRTKTEQSACALKGLAGRLVFVDIVMFRCKQYELQARSHANVTRPDQLVRRPSPHDTHLVHPLRQQLVQLLLSLAELLDVPLQVLHGRLHLRHLGLRASHLVHQLVVLQGDGGGGRA